MARVMLAVKTVLTEADQVPVLIFDEVDANIGGRTAVTVAEELVAISRRHQVLSITHLPQIAAAGERHFLVSKHVQDERTTTTMSALGPADREQEIARMLGAAEGSQVALTHAREMLTAAGGGAPGPRRSTAPRHMGAARP
jgi:DNA repair protein RecN (Recombination protein N)